MREIKAPYEIDSLGQLNEWTVACGIQPAENMRPKHDVSATHRIDPKTQRCLDCNSSSDIISEGIQTCEEVKEVALLPQRLVEHVSFGFPHSGDPRIAIATLAGALYGVLVSTDNAEKIKWRVPPMDDSGVIYARLIILRRSRK